MLGIGVSFACTILTAYIGYHVSMDTNNMEFWLMFKNNICHTAYHAISIFIFTWTGSKVKTEVILPPIFIIYIHTL